MPLMSAALTVGGRSKFYTIFCSYFVFTLRIKNYVYTRAPVQHTDSSKLEITQKVKRTGYFKNRVNTNR